ncbi:MAG: DNA polymerase [Clostridium sp.]|jgi:DNA polymerase|uniref:DNA polymerase n=1 Tax=Clostridium sp. TaxID=1506 RepID=UPI0025C59AB3|nr:DNA polymerase [Clostridium sp.]MCH3964576.1 DNA polymerase [Clostridium sp.]MCI1715047.1 DNA polymerase [Clostridium sp.]MCI1799309.1 DNA polymerase [Clostridium sp.]MCI1813230.1 DNA polymerase [Clostridium sp.]MCI1870121.1 DNA polymerase [Clostridium sp.]
MKFISIDIETFSSVNLQKSGVYRYAESEDFDILLFGYSADGGEVKVIELAGGEKIPIEIINALTDDSVIKWAFNAQFERICLSKWLGMKAGTYLSPKSWHCTMVWAATLGLPLSLEGVGAVLGLEKQKLSEGKNLIKYFCIPCTPTKSNGGRTSNLPQHDIQKWETFISYNKRDVETEMAIQNKLSKFPVSKSEWKNYRLDQIINDCGINLDMDFVRQAISCDEKFKTENIEKAKKLTGLENPNSPAQLKDWLLEQGMKTDSLSKAVVSELLEDSDGEIHEVLSIRQKLAKSSVKKYTAMGNVVCRDSRARGLIQFYGANRTGRYSGRLIQVQNLPQNHLPDLKQARSLVKDGNFTALDLLYDSIPSVLSELIRTAFIPMYGSRFIVADFSAIEARVIAWLAGERWRMDVFAGGGDIYCASASQMFNVPVEKNGINGHLRQKGKIAELALGYGGSVGALKAMGAVQMGFAEDELKPIVNAWRNSNPNITSLWWKIDRAVKTVVKTKQPIEIYGIGIFYQSGILFIKLPSGRRLAYVKPLIGENRFGGESVTYEGVGGTKKWERIESYGSKFAENIVQAISRDILAEAMLKLAAHGFEIVMHVHDEVVIEVQNKISSVEEVCRIMSETPAWAKGLILNADGYECEFYKKE